MKDKNKCDKYEAFFVFNNEEAFNAHMENCPDCKNEHEKYLKVSSLVKEVAPYYLSRCEKRRLSAVKKLACCFVLLVGITGFTGYKLYDDNSFQVNNVEDSYIGTTLGLPTDEYGFLAI